MERQNIRSRPEERTRVIEVRDLRVVYGKTTAVDGISFSVEQGEVFAIVGPNGAGKTSTVEAMLGLRSPESGTISVLGLKPGRRNRELAERLGVQLQQAALPDRMKVWEALDLYGSFYRHTVDWSSLLDQWGLSEKRNSRFDSLSGGQQQRLFVALALLNDPDIVFLDEITTGLDPKARRATLELVRRIRAIGKTVVLVSHYLDEVEALADRVAVMNGGRIVALGSPGELVDRHGNRSEVRFSAGPSFDLTILDQVPFVSEADKRNGTVVVRGHGPLLSRVAVALSRNGYEPEDLSVAHTGFEDVYFALTHTEHAEEAAG